MSQLGGHPDGPGVDPGIPTKEELAARSADFRWPPVTPPGHAIPAGPRRGAGTDVNDHPGSAAAESPDEPWAPPEPALADTPSPAGLPTPAPASTWSIVEHIWLDIVAPPLSERMARLGWAPDTPDRYCPRCAATVGPHEVTPDGCPECTSKRLPWSRIVRLGEYTPPLSHFVQEVKFTRWRRLGRELGELLAAAAVPALQAAGRDPAQVVVVPVPTTFRRRMVRGIDHTRVIAAAVARSLDAPLRQPLRREHRPSQLDVPPSQRAANVSGTIRLRSEGALRRATRAGAAATILVVDDVTTTGATLRATCSALRAALRATPEASRPYIWAAVIARTPPAGADRQGGGARRTEADRSGNYGSVWT